MRTAVAISPEAKAKLQTKFVAERVEEIRELLQEEGVESENVGKALGRLKKQVAKAAGIITKEKNKGKDVTMLAQEINEDIDATNEDLEEVFDEEMAELESEGDQLDIALAYAQDECNEEESADLE